MGIDDRLSAWRALAVAGAALAACAGAKAPIDSTEVVQVAGSAAARRAVGRQVRIDGTARIAKLSLVVAVDDLVVYCLDSPSWLAEKAGQRVSVRGVLQYTREFEARRSPEGEISQGTDEGVFVIRHCVP